MLPSIPSDTVLIVDNIRHVFLSKLVSDTVLIVDNIRHVFLSKLVSVVSSIFQIRIYKSSNALFHKKKHWMLAIRLNKYPPFPAP